MKRLATTALVALLAAPGVAGSQASVKKAAVSSVSPVGTRVGVEALRRGGNAVDAAVAVAFALAVTHPQSSILGGGGFLLYFDAATRSVWALDFREVAPLLIKPALLAGANGMTKPGGALSVAVPGGVSGLTAAHDRFGNLAWNALLKPAAALAREGLPVDARLAAQFARAKSERSIDQVRSTADAFYPDGKSPAIGARLRQNALAETLDRIGEMGASEFYRGTTARKIVSAMEQYGGVLNPRDLTEYQPMWRSPIRVDYRSYRIFTAPPPSDGGVILAEMLSILNPYDLASFGFQSPRSIHLIAEASRRAFIDRAQHAGDPAFARIPLQELLSEEHAARWRKSIELQRATTTLQARAAVRESTETTHISVVDAAGNAVSLTFSLGDHFGSGIVVPGCGFFLNNAMNGATLTAGSPDRDGLPQPSANTADPRKRVTSAMAPTIILDGEKLFMVIGTRGGPAIPTTLLQVFLNVAVYGLNLADAVAAPRYHQQATPDEIRFERGRGDPKTLRQLNEIGHGVREDEPMGDVHAIQVGPGGLTAVADGRDGGAAGGY
jgi:gamma-glutamyltranspeptidase/glutathione hydrolase